MPIGPKGAGAQDVVGVAFVHGEYALPKPIPYKISYRAWAFRIDRGLKPRTVCGISPPATYLRPLAAPKAACLRYSAGLMIPPG